VDDPNLLVIPTNTVSTEAIIDDNGVSPRDPQGSGSGTFDIDVSANLNANGFTMFNNIDLFSAEFGLASTFTDAYIGDFGEYYNTYNPSTEDRYITVEMNGGSSNTSSTGVRVILRCITKL
jgi:hypothetical protein